MGLKSFFIAQDLTFCEDLAAKILPWLMRTESMIRRRSFFEKMGGCSVGDFWTFKSSGVAEMFGRQAPVHDHNLGRLHEALLGKGIKKKGGRGWKGVELVREAWFCMIQCVLYISPWW